jgi:molybdenum cofactor cytidylyltransferase
VAVAAILLAAGRSERMGRQKALLDWHGQPLLAYQLRQLSEIDGIDIVVVTGFAAESLRPIIAAAGAREAHNPDFDAGKAGSIRTGTIALRHDAGPIVLLAVDQPRPAALIRMLLDSHIEGGGTITVPTHAGRRGHPIVFDGTLLAELRSVDDATLGVRALLARHAEAIFEVPVDDPIVSVDLNTPRDLERALAMMGRT